MSKLKVDTVTDVAGTGAPNFDDGATIQGVAIASVNKMQYDATTGAKPSGEMLGGVWINTATDEFMMYAGGTTGWTKVTSANAAPAWTGHTAYVCGGAIGGGTTSAQDTIDYISMASAGNASDFGDLTVARSSAGALSGGGRVLIGGGASGGQQSSSPSLKNTIDYIVAGTASNATDFGDLTQARFQLLCGSTGTRGVWESGMSYYAGSYNTIDYVTILTAANAVDFGDSNYTHYDKMWAANGATLIGAGGRRNDNHVVMSQSSRLTMNTLGNSVGTSQLSLARFHGTGVSGETRALFCGGYYYTWGATDRIDYFVYATSANAVDFGNLIAPYLRHGGASNAVDGFLFGSDAAATDIKKITLMTPSNSTDFGDLTVGRTWSAASGA
jgi:hypothetical protein|tara:strand:+ start:121 stop:1278 length:1158 start_codon:yes stop_codon:yes gene_type:complete